MQPKRPGFGPSTPLRTGIFMAPFHRAGENSSEAPRRGVNHLIGLPFLAQQIDIPRALGGRYADDPFLGRYLGYKWAPAASVDDWRRARMDRA